MKRLVPVLTALMLSGCFYPADRGRALEAKVDRLESDNSQLVTQLKETEARLSATLPKMDEKVAEMARAMESLDKASHRSDADIGIQLQKTVEDLAQLRGQVETYLFKINELESGLKKNGEDTERRLTELQGAEAVKAAEAKKKADELKRPDDKKEFFALAQAKAKAKDLPLARQLYGEFLKRWPKDELTGDAHFGLGESYYVEDRCREALFEYGKVIQEHAKSHDAPTAYLRSSECFKKLKMNDESKMALEELTRQFPKSDAAKTAKVRLQEFGKKAAPTAPATKKGKK